MSWLDTVKADWYSFKISYPSNTLIAAIYLPDFKVVLIYRLSQLFYKSKVLVPLAFLLVMLNDFLHGVWISFKVEIGAGVFMGHPRGLVIHPDTKVGRNLSIIHQITFGGKGIIIGDNVEIHSGAKIVNNKTDQKLFIGNGAVIGANAVVTKDVEENSVVVGVPAKLLKYQSQTENWFYRKEKEFLARKV